MVGCCENEGVSVVEEVVGGVYEYDFFFFDIIFFCLFMFDFESIIYLSLYELT